MADLTTEATDLLERVKGNVYGGVTLPWSDVVALYECLAAFAYQPAAQPAAAEPVAESTQAEPVGETQPGA